MDHLLAWQNLVFYIPLAVGLILVFGSAFGGHDTGGDHDADHDVGHDHDGHDGSTKGAVDAAHDHESTFVMKALSLLGVGRVPLTLVLMIMSFLFGGIGIISNAVLGAFLPVWLYGPVSIVVSSIVTLTLTGKSAKLLNRFMPTTETYRVSRHDFAGCTGKLLLPASPTEGYAQVKDHEGNVHNVKCRTVRGELPKGGDILVIEYDEEHQTCIVDANPVSTRSLN
ncbi:MAG TPA: hypothetical protein VL500_01185 [Candidatus Eisenbacteria bacterium]|jgi:membrane protein implicated in regulation of membrane protease activity|nr:hypothetical protein [Candidatus Eisenbacteria bacterium]